ncbi:MAG: IS4 family transposase [Polyangiaceae bacterium]
MKHTRALLDALFGLDTHAARVESLGNGVAGVLSAGVLSIHAIGHAYALQAGTKTKSGIKQIDRLLSNPKVDVQALQRRWVEFVVGVRKQIVVAMDWMEFDDDDHSTLCAYLVTRHGRATPLVWQTVLKSELGGRRTGIEHALVERLHRWLDPSIAVELLADRGFGDQKLYELLMLHGWDFHIRFRGNIRVQSGEGEARTAHQWVPTTGRALMLKNAKVTDDHFEVPAVVVVHAKGMKEPWCLATSGKTLTASQVVKQYGRRFTIEETFRDTKDLHFGMGLKATHIRKPERRDRMLLLMAMAHALLTLLGAASEATGMDAYLKANTVKRRTHSLFRQGTDWYRAIPNMRDDWLNTLMTAFDRIVREHAVFRDVFGIL